MIDKGRYGLGANCALDCGRSNSSRGFWPGTTENMLTRVSDDAGGATAFHGFAGELRFVGGYVQGDLDGHGWADFMIRVNAASLVASDLVL